MKTHNTTMAVLAAIAWVIAAILLFIGEAGFAEYIVITLLAGLFVSLTWGRPL
ncbi:hypothetical protein [Aquamicrobium sp.]|uniref:hypothetical protein n=1 Tax=Aquamicrobium sp. TaxID=1872579 RepID=UPI00258FF1E3|nr:hypothetical protein [Aquamicrobium sp.]MCK9549275.1 hypothetical protein [Aquamicrobium sp.]